ncbi:MAG TPA: hypothetical protein DEP35_10020 [Deltaproteobacteria bacterium]|nr:hypothetical protein [Deltaproteobacteria bacterium]
MLQALLDPAQANLLLAPIEGGLCVAFLVFELQSLFRAALRGPMLKFLRPAPEAADRRSAEIIG